MKINKKKLIFVLPIIMITMVSTTVIRKIKNKTPKISNEKLNQKVPVEIFQVKKNILVKTFNYTGLIKLNREVMISPRVNGIISKIYVDEGDRVKKGDILATLDKEDYKIKFNISKNEKEDAEIKVEQGKLNLEDSQKKIEIATLNLDNLIVKRKELHYKNLEEKSNFETEKANYLRDKTLCEKEALSRSAFEYSENKYKTAEYKLRQVETQEESINIDIKKSEIQVEQSRLRNKLIEKDLSQMEAYFKIALNNLNDCKNQLEYTNIKAKESGVILNLFSESGEVISPGHELIKLGVDDIVKITLGVGNKNLPFIKEGMEAEISIDSIPGKLYKGKVNKIMPSVNSNSGLTLIEINLDNKDHFFKENMFARIKLLVNRKENVLTVPKEFISTDSNNKKYLYVIENEIALKTFVTTGMESDSMIEISSGINENTIVASGNISHLKDNSKVLIWNNNPKEVR
ncbi:MAG: efflux RND transporter periplasmic adaptor subunit [Fusobacterium sp.]